MPRLHWVSWGERDVECFPSVVLHQYDLRLVINDILCPFAGVPHRFPSLCQFLCWNLKGFVNRCTGGGGLDMAQLPSVTSCTIAGARHSKPDRAAALASKAGRGSGWAHSSRFLPTHSKAIRLGLTMSFPPWRPVGSTPESLLHQITCRHSINQSDE